ncbi:MAG: AMP-binding protein [Desulfobacterales bacterium]|nr:AMP-binding protein [Desulfobacterales bacterium]
MAKPVRFTPEIFARYGQLGYWSGERLSDFWDQNAASFPDSEALADARTRLTWQQAKKWIDRMALGLLELGFQKDDMLVIQLPNCVELVLLRVAAEKASLLCAPVLRTFRHKEMAYILDRVGASGVVIPWRYRGFDYFQMVREIRRDLPGLKHIITVGKETPPGTISLDQMVAQPFETRYPSDYLKKTSCPPDEFSLVLTTSGSSGFPKFVEHPVCSRVFIGKVYAEAWNLTRDDVFGMVGPAQAGPNIATYLSAPIVGARVAMLEHFEAGAALQLIENEKVTIASLVPAQLAMLLRHPDFAKYDLSSLRMAVVTGSPLSYKLALEAEEKFKCPIVQYYGSVDAGGSMITSPGDPQEDRLLTAGRPMPGVEVKLVDDEGRKVPKGAVGEVWVRGATFISGYFKDPDATSRAWTSDGWFRMGDLGRWDDRGNVVIVGRKKDMIIRGGQNVYPVEIENILITHPKIVSVAIVAMPDPVMGERACAFIVPGPGAEVTFDEMVAFLKEKNLAMFKIPERLEKVDALPMVAADQKVDKKALQQVIRDKLADEGRL